MIDDDILMCWMVGLFMVVHVGVTLILCWWYLNFQRGN